MSDYYRDELPMKELARSIADEVYVFQQNNAPVRRERETVQLLRRIRLPSSFLSTCVLPTARTLIRLITAFPE